MVDVGDDRDVAQVGADASSAPAAMETTEAISWASGMPSPVWSATTHRPAAATSWRQATRLAARWMAPTWVRSPTFRMAATMFTATAMYSS